jgi:hypothetical protein
LAWGETAVPVTPRDRRQLDGPPSAGGLRRRSRLHLVATADLAQDPFHGSGLGERPILEVEVLPGHSGRLTGPQTDVTIIMSMAPRRWSWAARTNAFVSAAVSARGSLVGLHTSA